MKRRYFVVLGMSAAGFLGQAQPRAQATYPSRPITLVVPGPPGGGTDLIARLYAEHLTKELGQQVIVDNKTGGVGNVGAALAAQAKPDGYTLLMQYSSTHSANPAMMKDLNWGPKDFAPVALGAIAPQLLVIPKKVPASDLKGFIAYAKANPGKLNYATFGPGSVPHIATLVLSKAAGLDMVNVPYRGAGPLISDLLSGQVDLAVMSPPAVAAHIKAGNVKALAVATDRRLAAFPDIPTAAEAGLPGFGFDAWYGLFAPAGTPQPIIDRLNAAMRKIAKNEVVIARTNEVGTVLKDWSPAEFDRFVRNDGEVTRKLIQENNITSTE